VVISPQALLVAPPLKQTTAEQLVAAVRRLGGDASFRKILLEANSQGLLADHRTLRRYLDLLVDARIMRVREHDVGSVNLQQLYTVVSSKAQLWFGPIAMRAHGLSWDVPETQLYPLLTADLEVMLRAKPYLDHGQRKLLVGLEDNLVFELGRDTEEDTGTTELVAAMLATKALDLAYLFRRADSRGNGRTVRVLFKKITDTFTSLPGDVEGRVFLETRTRFLKILRYYNSKGILRLVDRPGRGALGLAIVSNLTANQIVSAAGKQLGVTG
jgi:hypothetical protein